MSGEMPKDPEEEMSAEAQLALELARIAEELEATRDQDNDQ
ncbi:MAG TPA: hypothetical protein VLF60_02580 [Candidatus Saccharimonadales bacterium]|nr:hypothetical protein [Candidatus Saccharimonadales bacterium]